MLRCGDQCLEAPRELRGNPVLVRHDGGGTRDERAEVADRGEKRGQAPNLGLGERWVYGFGHGARQEILSFHSAMQSAVAPPEVLVALVLLEPGVVQVAETGVGQFGIEGPQLPEVERIVLAVVDPRQRLDQAVRFSGTAMRLDSLHGDQGAADDLAFIPRQDLHPLPLAGGDRSPGEVEFIDLDCRDVGLDMDLLPGRGGRVTLLMGASLSEGKNRHYHETGLCNLQAFDSGGADACFRTYPL